MWKSRSRAGLETSRQGLEPRHPEKTLIRERYHLSFDELADQLRIPVRKGSTVQLTVCPDGLDIVIGRDET